MPKPKQNLLLPRPVRVTLGGADYYAQPGTALEWIEQFEHDVRLAVLPFLGAGPREDVGLRLATGELVVKDVERATFAVLEELTGHHWWWAYRVAHMGTTDAFLGELLLSAVRAHEVSLGQWCAAVYRIITRHADAKERIKIDFELDTPPEGYEEAWDDDVDYFRAMVEGARKLTRG